MRVGISTLWLALSISQGAYAADWYVDGKIGIDSNAGTMDAPFQTPWKGIQMAGPGDTVHLLPTVVYRQFGIIAKNGTAAAPITIEGEGNWRNRTKVRGDGSDFGIEINHDSNNRPSSYIKLVNFDVSARGTWSGIMVGAGCHHVVISGNRVHDSGGAGIATVRADYVTISNNVIKRNAKNTTLHSQSGITTWENTDIDDNTGVKMIITNNVIHDNTNTPAKDGGLDTDGNGIIIENLRHTQYDNVPYRGQTLITNNIVYQNGGRGIHAFESDHVSIVNNTVYHNNQDPYEATANPGEIMLLYSGDVQAYNNVSYSDGADSPSVPGSRHFVLSIAYGSGAPINVDSDIGYATDSTAATFLSNNSNSVTIGPNYLWTDPLFVDAPHHKFHLRSGSKGLQSGYPPVAPPTDIKGKNRPPAGPIEGGAYQQLT